MGEAVEQRLGRRPGPAIGLVVGIALGVLVAAIAIPRRQQTTTVSAAANGGTGAGEAGGSPAGGGGVTGGTYATGSAPGATSGAAAAGATTGGATGATTTGVAGSGGGGSSSGTGAAGATTGGSSPAGATARGVSADAIKIGIAYLDLSAVKYLGADYDTGDVPKQWNAVLDGWKRQGLLPVNGRTIQFSFSSYSVTDTSQQRASCDALIDDAKVFAVVSPQFFYQVGADCVAREHRTPLLTSDGPRNVVYQRGAPFLYTAMLSATDSLTNMVYWAQAKGLLKGHRIGVYYASDPDTKALVDESIRAPLAKLGYRIAAEYTTADANGGPEDALAVQRFRASGVDLVIMLTSELGFTQQASVQGYHPHYIGSDYNGYTTYLGAADLPPDEFDGALGVTNTDRGMSEAGLPSPDLAKQCVANYDRATGENVTVPGNGQHETAKYVYILFACDEGDLLLRALRAAGTGLTPQTFVAALQQEHGVPMASFPDVTFGPGVYEGVKFERTLQWHRACTCWQAVGSFEPLSMPAGG
jgi:hypothetical protein